MSAEEGINYINERIHQIYSDDADIDASAYPPQIFSSEDVVQELRWVLEKLEGKK